MFTGIVEGTGTLGSVDTSAGKLVIRTAVAKRLRRGESIAVNGACLTVTRHTAGSFQVDVSPETFARTSFGALRTGDRVNLERALRADARLAGHFLQGHVDGTGRFLSRKPEGEFARYRFAYPPELEAYLIPKGSIGVHGVSLTIAKLGAGWFDVALIPLTLTLTNLGRLRPGDPVNLEGDMIGKFVVRYLEVARQAGGRRRRRDLVI